MEDEVALSLDGKTVGNLRVVDLKQELEKRGLSKSGSKKDLVKRLKQQLEFEKLYEERKTAGDGDLKLELDAATEQNEFVQQYLAQQQKLFAEQNITTNISESEETVTSDEGESDDEMKNDKNNDKISEGNEHKSKDGAESGEEIKREELIVNNKENMSESECVAQALVQKNTSVNIVTSENTSEQSRSCKQVTTVDMEPSTQCPTVPYSLSDIQLPESPGKHFSKSVVSLDKDEPSNNLDQGIKIDCDMKSNGVKLSLDTSCIKNDSLSNIQESETLQESVGVDVQAESTKRKPKGIVEIERKYSKEKCLVKEDMSETLNQCKVSQLPSSNIDTSCEQSKNPVKEKRERKTKSSDDSDSDKSSDSGNYEKSIKSNLKDKEAGGSKSKDSSVSRSKNLQIRSKSSDSRSKTGERSVGKRFVDSHRKSRQKSKSRSSESCSERDDRSVSNSSVDSVGKRRKRSRSKSSDSYSKRGERNKSKSSNERQRKRSKSSDRYSKGYELNASKSSAKSDSKRKHRSRSKSSESHYTHGQASVRKISADSHSKKRRSRSKSLESHSKRGMERHNRRKQRSNSSDSHHKRSERSRSKSSDSHHKRIERSRSKSSTESHGDRKHRSKSSGSHNKQSMRSRSKSSDSGSKRQCRSRSNSSADSHIKESKPNASKTFPGRHSRTNQENIGNESKDRAIKENKPNKSSDRQSNKTIRSRSKSSDDNCNKDGKSPSEIHSKHLTEIHNISRSSSPIEIHSKSSEEIHSKRSKSPPDIYRRSNSPVDNQHKSSSQIKSNESVDRHSRSRESSPEIIKKVKSDEGTDENSVDMSDCRKSVDEEPNLQQESLIKASASVPLKQRLKIKRDNVIVQKVSKPQPPSENASSEKLKEPEKSASPESVEAPEKEIKEAEILPKPYVSRKVTLSNRKLSRSSVDEKDGDPKQKKSKWGSFASVQKSSQNINISSSALKNWFPDFKLINEPSSIKELPSDEHSLVVKEIKQQNTMPEDLIDNEFTTQKRISLPVKENFDEDMQSLPTEEPMEQGPVSKLIFIQNLVRPFTLLQLKDLLKQSGHIVEEFFWIDKIKSKCFVMYKTEEEAVNAKKALNNTRWPPSNPKILKVEFATEEDLEFHKRGCEPPKSIPETSVEPIEVRTVLPIEDHKRKEREHRKEREKLKPQLPVREWDKDKIIQDSPERDLSLNKENEKAKVYEKKEKKESKRRANEDTPAKLLDDLFQKTKASPCIYWLPLTDEQVKEKEEAKRMRRLEREKRNQKEKDVEESDRRNKPSRPVHRSREREQRRTSSRSRSPLTRRR